MKHLSLGVLAMLLIGSTLGLHFADAEVTPVDDALFDQPVFTADEESLVMVDPVFDDRRTNIAFYIKCPSVTCPDRGTEDEPFFQFSAENLGHGNLPFSEYWAPPALGEYVAVEYHNDAQQFTCSDLSLEACVADPHFIHQTHFVITTDEGVALAKAAEELASQQEAAEEIATAEEQEEEIHIVTTSTIAADLDTGEVVSASIDGMPLVIDDATDPATRTETLITGDTNADGTTTTAF